MGPSHIGLVMALADGDHIGNVLDAGLDRVLHTAEVGGEGIHLDIGVLLQRPGGQLRGVRHLGDRFGADKGGDFELLHARVHDAVDQIRFLLEGQHLLEVLPAVSRADFNHSDLLLLHVLHSLQQILS